MADLMSIFPKHLSPGRTVTLHCRVGQRPSVSDLAPIHIRGTVTSPTGRVTVVMDRPALLSPFLRHITPDGVDPDLLRFDPIHHLIGESTSQALLDQLTLQSLAALGLDKKSNLELMGALGKLGLNRFTEMGLIRHLASLLLLGISDHYYAQYTVEPDADGGEYGFLLEVTHPDGRVSRVEDSFFVEAVEVTEIAKPNQPAQVINRGDAVVYGHIVQAFETNQPVLQADAQPITLSPRKTIAIDVSDKPAWLIVAEGTTQIPLNASAQATLDATEQRASA